MSTYDKQLTAYLFEYVRQTDIGGVVFYQSHLRGY